MIHGVLTASKKRAGLFTSPYVTAATEKIKSQDAYISAKDLIKIVEDLKPAIDMAKKSKYGAPSSFEMYLAIAFIYFKKEKCEWVVLEAGLGGRYDATNIVPNGNIAAITNVDYDHTEILGKTLKEIAFDKAGIIKSKTVFFSTEKRSALKEMFKKIGMKEGAASVNFIHSKGDHTKLNLALVTAIGNYIGIEKTTIQKGIEKSRLPCRFEIMETKPLIILDGAHNRAKINATVSEINQLKKLQKIKKIHLIILISNTHKDKLAILKPIVPLADFIYITPLTGEGRKSVHPLVILPYVLKLKKTKTLVEIVDSPEQAMKKARKNANTKNNDCIIATGSFFLAGALREIWYKEEWVVHNRKSFA